MIDGGDAFTVRVYLVLRYTNRDSNVNYVHSAMISKSHIKKDKETQTERRYPSIMHRVSKRFISRVYKEHLKNQ